MKNSILAQLPENFPWRDRILCFDSIDSTNDHAKQLAAAGAKHGTVLIADRQTGGRGRLGRTFHSPGGVGVYLSVILRPNCPAQELMHLTCAAAVAMCDAVENAAGFRPGIKWTNDLVFGKKKLGGILTELSITPETGLVQYAIIGIGINCCQAAEDFPPELRDMAASLSMVTDQPLDRSRLAAAMIQALQCMDLTRKAEIMDAYRADCITLGNDVIWTQNGQTQYGKALDIDEDGGLIVKFRDGDIRTVSSGEVSVRGMYGYA